MLINLLILASVASGFGFLGIEPRNPESTDLASDAKSLSNKFIKESYQSYFLKQTWDKFYEELVDDIKKFVDVGKGSTARWRCFGPGEPEIDCFESVMFFDRLNVCNKAFLSKPYEGGKISKGNLNFTHYKKEDIDEIIFMIQILDKLQASEWYLKMKEWIPKYEEVEHNCAVHAYSKLIGSILGSESKQGSVLYEKLKVRNDRNNAVKIDVDNAVKNAVKIFQERLNQKDYRWKGPHLKENWTNFFATPLIQNVLSDAKKHPPVQKEELKKPVEEIRCRQRFRVNKRNPVVAKDFHFPKKCLRRETEYSENNLARLNIVAYPNHKVQVRMTYKTERVMYTNRRLKILGCRKAGISVTTGRKRSMKPKEEVCTMYSNNPETKVYTSECNEQMDFEYKYDPKYDSLRSVENPVLNFRVAYIPCNKQLSDDGEGLQVEQISTSKLFDLALSLFLI